MIFFGDFIDLILISKFEVIILEGDLAWRPFTEISAFSFNSFVMASDTSKLSYSAITASSVGFLSDIF